MLETLGALERFAAETALVDQGREITYRELIARADALAGPLPARSLVFLQAKNTVEAVAAYLGCLRGGHVVHLIGETESARLDGLVGRYRPNALIRPNGEGVEVQRLSEASAALHPDLRVLLSTSGSTGSPKLVKLSGRNLASNARAIADYLGLSTADRAITSLDFSYAYGLSVLHSHWAAGAALVLTEASAVSAEFWTAFAQGGATSLAGVPYTFELLAARNDDWAATPGLRYVTQAGGRLAPELARKVAGLGARHGWDFYIMYGQTEAAPRMAYLPPQMALSHADCIGVAIPGGELSLVDDELRPIEAAETPGQLRYDGPNVMMGYASDRAALALDETPPALMTGDIAVRTAEGLYRIVGRVSRIVKPYGVRVQLDEVQAIARQRLPDAVAAGTDSVVVIATTHEPPADFVEGLAASLRLPALAVGLVRLAEIPRLASGKVDYPAILRRAGATADAGRADAARAATPFLERFLRELRSLLGLASAEWTSVRDIYSTLLGRHDLAGSSSFASLAGDSLTYVQITLALEDYLGRVPEGWESLSLDELEEARHEPSAL